MMEAMTTGRLSRRVALQGVGVALVCAVAASSDDLAGAATARALRRGFDALDPVSVLEVAAALAGLGLTLRLFPALGRHRLAAGLGRLSRRLGDACVRVPAAVALSGVVAAAALARAALGAASDTPKVLGDELIYSGLAKGWAFHGRPLVRGVSDVGHSTLYSLFLAPVFRWSVDGASALATVRVIDAVAMAATAVPAYLLARRVVPHGSALGVAALTVLAPWTAYSALTMTESFFYPAFVAFAAVLVWTLERPTLPRQAALLASLALVVGIRAQGLAVALGAAAAIVTCGALEGRTRATLRRFVPTFATLGIGLMIGVGAKLAGVAVPTSSYDAVFGSVARLGRMFEWAAWNVASLELGLGVVALAAFPVALHGMLRGPAGPARTTAVVALALGLSLLASVALLSASPYGLGVLHERNLFYVTPLVLTCLAHWLRGGLVRPVRLAAGSAACAVGLACWLQGSAISGSNNVDSLSVLFFRSLDAQTAWGSPRVWAILLSAAGAAAFLLARRVFFPLLTVVLAFAAVGARADYTDALTGSQASDLAWVDHALPAGSSAALVYLGVPYPSAPCASVAAAEQQDFTIWTEFFNVKVDQVTHVYADDAASGLASPALTVGRGGLVTEDGRPYRPGYVVLDTRQPIAGEVIERFDLSSLHGVYENGASLTLWRVDPPLRFAPRASPLPPKADGGGC